ncbi:hypothetical protein OG920_04870 [Streptomyces europaeiscabiei]|uniref:hypothetical protein n=1 Tax=Streptomyces europaeiscabiei TaxID=146819 RepID=UPI002E18C663|nr:hypothetical protein OG858_04930 [Streptomyces europaeiscabiei]
MDSRTGRFGVAVAAALAVVLTDCCAQDDGSWEWTKPSYTTSDADDRDSAPERPR